MTALEWSVLAESGAQRAAASWRSEGTSLLGLLELISRAGFQTEPLEVAVHRQRGQGCSSERRLPSRGPEASAGSRFGSRRGRRNAQGWGALCHSVSELSLT